MKIYRYTSAWYMHSGYFEESSRKEKRAHLMHVLFGRLVFGQGKRGWRGERGKLKKAEFVRNMLGWTRAEWK